MAEPLFNMDLKKLIAELEAERERLTVAILALERLVANKGKRRGRPPKWLADNEQGANTSPAETVTGSDNALSRAAGKRG